MIVINTTLGKGVSLVGDYMQTKRKSVDASKLMRLNPIQIAQIKRAEAAKMKPSNNGEPSVDEGWEIDKAEYLYGPDR